jgi:hypothetical protein
MVAEPKADMRIRGRDQQPKAEAGPLVVAGVTFCEVGVLRVTAVSG